ncbi:MAG TPA: flagellar hook-length control protein FliK [Pusillimonas sp.]|uniref:flagellar hook-length control protein FliK n=2 Tax=unclassified Pusillimonas TaxID=2640016 RepID=UPI002B4B1626|nr:flagellar hook-length control protein FliK [Pusillimonas sp.]HLU18563.1 flagellar hook-length control protein FliK [Pusillimonas sp.]
MSIGGNSNLGTLLIRRLDTALSIQASQQSQLVSSARADAIAQLADAARINPVHNQTDRPLPETIEKAQAQVERQARRTAEGGRTEQAPAHLRMTRPAIDTSMTPSAPTSLGSGARTILALLSLFPDTPPPLQGRRPLLPASPAPASTPGAGGTSGLPPGTGAGTSAPAAGSPAAGPPAAGTPAVQAATSTPVRNGLPVQLVRALAQALQQSGAFYESHLHDLVQGNRNLDQLRQEPQGRLAATGQPGSPSTGAGASSSSSPALSQPGQNLAADIRNPSAPSAAATTPGSTTGVHPDTQPVVRQQLEILATQTMTWRGEVWPETPMEWEVARQNEDGRPDEAGTHWSTRLRLTFPELGQIEARISLHDKQVVMRMVAPNSASTLAQHDQALRAGFAEAGLTLSQLSILKEDQP